MCRSQQNTRDREAQTHDIVCLLCEALNYFGTKLLPLDVQTRDQHNVPTQGHFNRNKYSIWLNSFLLSGLFPNNRFKNWKKQTNKQQQNQTNKQTKNKQTTNKIKNENKQTNNERTNELSNKQKQKTYVVLWKDTFLAIGWKTSYCRILEKKSNNCTSHLFNGDVL